MLKSLLYVCASLLVLTSYGQSASSGEQDTSEMSTLATGQAVTDVEVKQAEQSKVTLTWKVKGSMIPGYFVLERSENGRVYEVVSVLKNLSMQNFYQWTDDAPIKARSFYRIRYSFQQGSPLYSATVTAEPSGALSFKFYPNPVDQILIVRCESLLDVQISDASGKSRIVVPRVHGLQTINVGILEKGIYLIRFSNKLTNVIFQEKLIKN